MEILVENISDFYHPSSRIVAHYVLLAGPYTH
jgi:hypothetical protein